MPISSIYGVTVNVHIYYTSVRPPYIFARRDYPKVGLPRLPLEINFGHYLSKGNWSCPQQTENLLFVPGIFQPHWFRE
jgi:hypothetical protein